MNSFHCKIQINPKKRNKNQSYTTNLEVTMVNISVYIGLILFMNNYTLKKSEIRPYICIYNFFFGVLTSQLNNFS